MNLFDELERVAGVFADLPAVISGSKYLTYCELVALTSAAAHRLQRAGIQPGDVVMVLAAHSVHNLFLGLALARTGAVPVTCGGQPAAVCAELARRFQVRALAGQANLFPSQDLTGSLLRLPIEPLLAAPAPGEAVFANCQLPTDAPMRVSMSSGSTGTPQGLVWSHQGVLLSVGRATMDYSAGDFVPGARHLVFMDIGTSFGFSESLRALLAGATLVLPVAGAGMAELVRCLDMYGPSSVSLPVSQASALLDHVAASPGPGAGGPRFPTLRRLVTTGETMPPQRWQQLTERICAGAYSAFGTTESGMLGVRDPQTLRQYPDAAGRLLEGVQAQALDDSGQVLPAGQSGALRFRKEVLALGYLGDAERTRTTFRDGWFYSSDTGSVDAQGIVRLGARRNDLFELDGRQIDPLRIESVLNQLAHVQESAAFVTRDTQGKPVLMALYAASAAVDPGLMRQACLAQLGEALTPHLLVQVEAIPRTAGGKLSRRQLADRVRPAGPDRSPPG